VSQCNYCENAAIVTHATSPFCEPCLRRVRLHLFCEYCRAALNEAEVQEPKKMGREARSIEVSLTIDNHGDDRRPRDLELTKELRERIKQIVAEEKYQELSAYVL
jgi:hypothetical protein